VKRKPKTDLKIAAGALLVVAAAFLVAAAAVVPAYHAIFGQPWQKSFVTEVDFRFYKTAFIQVCFILFPLVGAVNIWAAWKILSCAKRIPDDLS
jgi:hypothetical protein